VCLVWVRSYKLSKHCVYVFKLVILFTNQVKYIIERFGKDNLNINNKSLQEIFNNEFWQYIVDSWSKDLSNGRIFECAMTCGSKLTKVWDQGGNNR
jgi:hypothetical protein